MSIFAGDIRRLLSWIDYAQRFPDYPKAFIPPALTDSSYVPPDQGNTTLISAVVLMAVSILVTIARLMARRFRAFRKFRSDDLLLLPAILLTIGFSIAQILDVKRGCAGRHSYDCSYDALSYSYTLRFASNILYVCAVFHIKATIVAYLLNICPMSRFIVRVLIYLTGMFVGLSFIISLFMSVFYCRPVTAAYNLDRALMQPQCNPVYLWNYVWAILYAIANFTLLFLAAMLVPHIEDPHKQILGMVLLFACAIFACISSIIRATFIRGAWNSFDPTWRFVPLVLGSQFEISFGLIAIAMPPLSILLLDYEIPVISKISRLLESISYVGPGRGSVESAEENRGRARKRKSLLNRWVANVAEEEPQIIRETQIVQASENIETPQRILRVPRRTESDSGSEPNLWRETRLRTHQEVVTPPGSYYEVVEHSQGETTDNSEQASDLLVIQRPISPSLLSDETEESIWGLSTGQFR